MEINEFQVGKDMRVCFFLNWSKVFCNIVLSNELQLS